MSDASHDKNDLDLGEIARQLSALAQQASSLCQQPIDPIELKTFEGEEAANG